MGKSGEKPLKSFLPVCQGHAKKDGMQFFCDMTVTHTAVPRVKGLAEAMDTVPGPARPRG